MTTNNSATSDKNIRKERLVAVSLYKKNTQPYYFILISTILELYFVISVLGVMSIDYLIGFTVMFNIIMLFMLFNTAVQVNVYSYKWSIVCICIGCYLIFRIFISIPFILKPIESNYSLYIINAIASILLLAAGIKSCYNIKKREALKKKLEGLS